MDGGHVIISGGSRGLGAGIVAGLLGAGYRVTTFSRTATPFVEELRAQHPERFRFLAGDVVDAAATKRIVEEATGTFGPPYGLINNAGIASDGVLATMQPTEIERLLAVNLAGPLHLSRHTIRAMLLRRGGRIINISSIIGVRGYRGLAVYAATKAGIDAVTRSLARELGSRQITVNSVAPGYLETEMSHGLDAGQREQIVRRTPLGRLGTPEDVTGVVLFLLSDAARFVTGQTLVVDGGVTC